MKLFLICICSLLTGLCRLVNGYVPTSGKQTLLYYVTNEESLNTIDKMNKVSLLSNDNNNCKWLLNNVNKYYYYFY